MTLIKTATISADNKANKTYELNNNTIITQKQLDYWNSQLSAFTPQDILKWAIITFPHLYQTTAFGLTGLATIDMLSKLKISSSVPLIFIDTLHHFPQTLDLLKKIDQSYYNKDDDDKIYVFKPKDCSTEAEFESKYGSFLWEKDEDKYDFLVKVEPAARAYKELKVTAVLTGRRKSQGGARANLKFVEIDELNQIIKINPLANWDFKKVKSYIDENEVPYNELLDLGYKSVGDYHSTQPVGENEDERSGRWKGKVKTECGIHETSRFAKFLQEKNENNDKKRKLEEESGDGK
ncbi:probable Phosphoadenosine phosphosulfate reductase [Saccharomycodes ludwigii]|uniref:phosphoadenylyl-sulfate reductase (thioredoxin) n=1 Tax=Saccharomycodes ludwigii TaxID=36035 RepID=A0A376BAG9_9ASCO|nr:hypothetical protein SCDLUD_000037 [Saccharomycodes ludwigii]KAH3902460.1 hypothetical protein SCDLUD_000037 [Saccharomycodes ludwigii]SSD61579.1 probable Phosphoadenosine phosphosulfate reductase [Saccharomycodes ludwigii]